VADIFISYSNGDGEDAASILDSHLTSRFGADSVFRDVHSIPSFGHGIRPAARRISSSPSISSYASRSTVSGL
jgi:hypothetical protein